jgi:hypothetical protein
MREQRKKRLTDGLLDLKHEDREAHEGVTKTFGSRTRKLVVKE